MTDQEAISVLESINAKTDYFLINDDARAEAIDMAISALQAQDLQSTCNQLATDTISRQAAIDALYSIDEYNALSVKTIKELPSAQPLVIHCTDCEGWLKRQSVSGFTVSELPSAQPGKATCYGYDVNELNAFAQVCRKNGISDTDLKDFVRNYANAWDLAFRNYEEHFQECLKKVMEGIRGDTND